MGNKKYKDLYFGIYDLDDTFNRYMERYCELNPEASPNTQTYLEFFSDFKKEYYKKVFLNKLGLGLKTLFSFLCIPIIAAAAVGLIVLTAVTEFMGDLIVIPMILILIAGIIGIIFNIGFIRDCIEDFLDEVINTDWVLKIKGILYSRIINPLIAQKAGVLYDANSWAGGWGYEFSNEEMKIRVNEGLTMFGTGVIAYLNQEYPFETSVDICTKDETIEGLKLIENIDHPQFAEKFYTYCDNKTAAFSTLTQRRMDILANDNLGFTSAHFGKDKISFKISKNYKRTKVDLLAKKGTDTDFETAEQIIEENAKNLNEFIEIFYDLLKE